LKSKLVVTGGAGFIGSHLVEKFLLDGYAVISIDNLSTGKIDNLNPVKNLKSFEFVRGSILDENLISRLIKDSDGCIHLGAALGVKQILSHPYISLTTNIRGTENVIQACSRYGRPLFLASTSEIYGKNAIQPLTEESDRVIGSPQKLRWAYSEAKALDETIAEMFRLSADLKYTIGRFFNTVGPRQTGAYGMVLPRFVQAALSGESLEVYGDGKQTRVFCHINDAVRGIVSLYQSEEFYGQAFNIGGEGEISIAELAERVIRLSGSKSKIRFVPYSEAYAAGFEETFRRVPDTTKLRKAINWKPQFSLDDIILDVIKYFSSNGPL